MKVSKWYNNQDIRIEAIPRPVPKKDEMLIKVHACGICGSDIVEWYRLPRAPLIQGHEIGAEVVEAGADVKTYKPGDRIFVAPKVPCMSCSYCKQGHYPVCTAIKDRLPGGFAEYLVVPGALIENGAYLLPDQISFDRATFIEPLACVVRAQHLSGLTQGQTILVLGCGMSGLLHVKLAHHKKSRIVGTDVSERRRLLAENSGAEMTIDAADDVPAILVAETGAKADVVVLCTSAMSAIEQAWQSVDSGGTIVFFAVPGPDKQVQIPINSFWTREIQIRTSYYCGPPDIQEAMDLITSGAVKVDDLISHTFPLSDIEKGFQLVMSGTDSMKVIIHPNR